MNAEEAEWLEYVLPHLEPEKVLAYYGVEVRDRRPSYKHGGYELDAECPFHATTSVNFSMHSRTGNFYCRSSYCGAKGNLIGFVRRQEHCEPDAAYRHLCHLAEIEPQAVDALSRALGALSRAGRIETREKYVERSKPIGFPPGYQVIAHPYLVRERLISPEVLLAAEAGIIRGNDFYRHRACIPVKMKGAVYSVYSRRVSENVEQWAAANPGVDPERGFRRHDYTGATLTSRLLFGVDDLDPKRPVILVEGIVNVLRMRTLGIDNGIAMLKADLSEDQLTMLIENGVGSVIICNDNDYKVDPDTGMVMNPGMKAAWKNYHKLKRYLDARVAQLPANRDPGDTRQPFTTEELMSYFESAFEPQRRKVALS